MKPLWWAPGRMDGRTVLAFSRHFDETVSPVVGAAALYILTQWQSERREAAWLAKLARVFANVAMAHYALSGGDDWILVGDTHDATLSIRLWLQRLFAFHGGGRDPASAFFLSDDRRSPLTYGRALDRFRFASRQCRLTPPRLPLRI